MIKSEKTKLQIKINKQSSAYNYIAMLLLDFLNEVCKYGKVHIF